MVILSTEAPPTCCWKKLVDFSEWDEKVLKWHQSKLAGNINGLYVCSSRKKVCHDQSPVFNCCCGCVGFLPWGRHVELMSCRINRSRGEVTSCSQVLLLFCPPPVCVNVTGYLQSCSETNSFTCRLMRRFLHVLFRWRHAASLKAIYTPRPFAVS